MFSKFLLLFVFRKFNASTHCRFSKYNQIHDRPPTTESKRTIFRCKLRLLCDVFQPKKIFFYEIFLSFSPSTLRLASKSNCSRPFYRRFFSLPLALSYFVLNGFLDDACAVIRSLSFPIVPLFPFRVLPFSLRRFGKMNNVNRIITIFISRNVSG